MEIKKENDFNTENKYRLKNSYVRLGDIYLCYFGINVGSEQNGVGPNLVRPVIIINIFSNNFFLVAPLTTKKHTGNWYIKVSFNKSFVILNQIRPIDIDRLVENIGYLSEDELKNIIDKYIKLIEYRQDEKNTKQMVL